MITEVADGGTPSLAPLGTDGVLARFAEQFSPEANRAAQAFAARAGAVDGVTETVPALASTLVRFDPAQADRAGIVASLRALLEDEDWLALPPRPATRRWHLPVSFDGADAPGLAEAAAEIGLSEARTIAQILEAAPRVLAIGFAPGQPYMGLMPEAWDIPRRPDLRRVPAGALALAIRQMVLFTGESPTGWLQVGRAAFHPFQPDAADPMPLRPGDEIRLERISAEDRARLAADPMGGARLEHLA